jgi:glycyl-tRNA synthetase beta chain
MSYQRPDGATVQFVRPAHALVALHGDTVVPLTLLGLTGSNVTEGHRFLTAPGQRAVTIANADAYAATLKARQGAGLVEERKEQIRAELLAKAGADQVLMPEALLDEVTALVEWPVVYECKFEEEFLAVPQECLILTMQTNQKYFALTDTNGKLRSRFLIVSNIATDTPAAIIGGNERVVRPRLSDAKFFFEQDKKKTLESRLPLLKNVVYHNKLGTQAERSERVPRWPAPSPPSWAPTWRCRARRALAKADLLTDMVGEFPELQGIMGTYYARNDGEPKTSRWPHRSTTSRALPATPAIDRDRHRRGTGRQAGNPGRHLGHRPAADRRQRPVRAAPPRAGRAAHADRKRLPLSISGLLADAARSSPPWPASRTRGRRHRLHAGPPARHPARARLLANEIEAVVAQNPDRLDDIVQRLEAVQAFAALPESASLAAANKRITNILKKNEEAGCRRQQASTSRCCRTWPKEPERRRGARAAGSRRRLRQGDFAGTLKTLAQLRTTSTPSSTT